ncbi:MAG: TonB-dependent receptor [Pyrinomonadaceae bacterium]
MKNLLNQKITQTVSLLTILLFLSYGVFAQSNTGSITGIISDPNGAAIANATVVITNTGTNETRTAQSDSDGHYEAPSLSTGIYKVTAAASGFQETAVTGARVAVGEKLRVDVKMNVGAVGATVVVTADQTPTNTETSETGDTITTQRINNLPINGRDFTQLLATVPGSVQTTNQFQTSINGIPSTFGGSSVLVDGIDAGRVDLNGTSNVLGRIESRVNRVSLDSIQEVQVLEQTYSAQYGEAIGSVINPITKSGTNDFHGGLFEYFRNEKLDANDFFANEFGFPRAKFELNQFGGNISGPIVKDKLFFFANYEGVRQTRGTLLRGLVPTARFRATFAPAIAPVLATLPLPNTSITQTFNGNPFPQLGLYTIQKNGKLREDTGSVKLDYHYSDRSQFSMRYNLNDSDTITPYGVGTDQTANGTLRVQLFKFSNTYAFSSNSVNEAAFGINRNVTRPGAGPSTLPIFSFLFVDQAIANPGPAQFNQYRTGTVYQFLDTFSFIRGNHSFKTGTDIRLNRRGAESDPQQTLQFFGVNDFASNVPFIAQRSGNPLLNYANENYSFFFQDDWKARPRLTLNLGLRYDISSVSREKNGLLQNFDLATKTFTPPGQKLYDVDKNNFAPRVGFAYDVFGNQKTVLRGGFGIFYNQELPASFGSPQANSFPSQSVDLFTALFNCGIFISYPVDPAAFACSVPDAYIIQKKIPTTYAEQWSLNVQQNLGFGVLQVGYVGNHVLHILTNGVVTPRNINRMDPFTGVRPISGIGNIYVVGGYPQSNYNAMQVTFKRNFSKGLRFNANYTWAHEIDDVIGFFKDYQDENNLRGDRASGDQDIRHNFTFDAGYDIPSLHQRYNNLPGWLVDGFQLNTITQIRSGFPVNVTLTGGIFGGSLRPDLVPGVSPYPSNYSVPNNQFNAAAFSNPGNRYGNLGRNALRGPGFAQVDFSIFKNTRIGENKSLQLRMEIFNIFNRPNFADPSGGLNKDPLTNSLAPSAAFGQSVETVGNQLGGLLGFGTPRQIQLSARFIF